MWCFYDRLVPTAIIDLCAADAEAHSYVGKGRAPSTQYRRSRSNQLLVRLP